MLPHHSWETKNSQAQKLGQIHVITDVPLNLPSSKCDNADDIGIMLYFAESWGKLWLDNRSLCTLL
jgi:hypothetical protein